LAGRAGVAHPPLCELGAATPHPIDGRISTLHHLLALWGEGGAGEVLSELGITYKALLDRLATEGTRLIEADDWRPDEQPLEGWDHPPRRLGAHPPAGAGPPPGPRLMTSAAAAPSI
jgi:hypothetical protein